MKNKQFKIPLLGAAVVLLMLVFGSVFAFAADFVGGGVERTSGSGNSVLYKIKAVSGVSSSDWSNTIEVSKPKEKIAYAAVYDGEILIFGKAAEIPTTAIYTLNGEEKNRFSDRRLDRY